MLRLTSFFALIIIVAAFSTEAKVHHGKSKATRKLQPSDPNHAFSEASKVLSKLEYDVEYLRLLEEGIQKTESSTLQSKIDTCIGVDSSAEETVTDPEALNSKTKLQKIRYALAYAASRFSSKMTMFKTEVGRTQLTADEMSCSFLNAIANIALFKDQGNAEAAIACKAALKTVITNQAKVKETAGGTVGVAGQIVGALGGGSLGALISAGLHGTDAGLAAVTGEKLGGKLGKRLGKSLGRNLVVIARYFNPINGESDEVKAACLLAVDHRKTVKIPREITLSKALVDKVEGGLYGLSPDSESMRLFKEWLKQANKKLKNQGEKAIDSITEEDIDETEDAQLLKEFEEYMDTNTELADLAINMLF